MKGTGTFVISIDDVSAAPSAYSDSLLVFGFHDSVVRTPFRRTRLPRRHGSSMAMPPLRFHYSFDYLERLILPVICNWLFRTGALYQE